MTCGVPRVLVIDTGIHQDGWSRQQAIDYLANHTALTQHEVELEVDRSSAGQDKRSLTSLES